MAETELSIVVRARDQLTATLRQMGTTVEELARKVAADFGQAGRGADVLVAGVRQSVAATQGLAGETARAVEQMRQLGQADTSRLEVAISTTRAEVEKLRAAAANELIPGDAAAKAERLEQEVREAQQALDSLRKTGAEIDIATRIAQAEQAVESLGQHASLAPLEAEIARAEAELGAMREQATRAGGAIAELDRTRMDRLASDVREGQTALVRLRGGTDQAREGASLLGSTFHAVGAGIKAALLPILPILTLAGAAFAAQRSVTEALALEDALSRINAEANLTATELDVLRNGALSTARALGLSESAAAPALLGAVTDGARNAAEGLDRFQAAARLAAARGEDVGKVTDALTSILNAYRGANLEAARASDVLFTVASSGKVDVEELSGALDGVLPLASALGVRFEELGAIIVTATQKGGSLAQGMQAVRAVLGTLTEAGPEARVALEGVDFSAARIRAEGLVPVLQDISTKLRGNAEAIKAVFPDGRAFGAVLGLLADQGAGLTAALGNLANSSGAVEQALGRRLRDPVFQLGVLFNGLRSSFAEAFGGAFLRSVERAIEQMGGMERASRTVAEVARTIGSVFGSVMPAVASLVAEAAKALKGFIDSFGGVEQVAGRMRAVGDAIAEILGASLQIARAEIEALIRTILLIPQTILGVKNELGDFFTGGRQVATEELEIVKREIQSVQKALIQASSQTLRFGAFDKAAFQKELAVIADELGTFRDDPAARLRFKPEVDKLDLENALRDLKNKEASIQVRVDAPDLSSLSSKVDAIQRSLEPVEDGFSRLGAGLKNLGAAVVSNVALPTQRTLDQVRAALGETEEEIQSNRVALVLLGAAARRSFAELTGPDLDANLAQLAAQARAAELALGADRRAAEGLRSELESLLATRLDELKAQLREAEKGFIAAKDQAALLGLTDPSQLARAVGAIGAQSDDASRKVEALRAEIEALTAERRKLFAQAPEPQVIATPLPKIDFGALAAQYLAGFQDLGKKIADRFDPSALARIGKRAGTKLRDAILAGVGIVDPFEETLRTFRGGIEPSLGRQVQLIEEQVDRQRDATAALREALPLLRTYGLLTQGRIDLLDEETDKLEQSVDLLRRRAALETSGLRRQAISLGIEPELDEDELRVVISETQDRLEREHLALRLGVEVDDAAIADAQRELQKRADALELRQVQREAVHFGLAIDERGVEQLQADIAEARDQAQEFADSLQGRGIRSEALALGIAIDGKSGDQIERDISDLHMRAQEFANAHPIEADLLRGAIDGGSRALADFITGARSGKEALRDFFTSMAAQAAQAAAQLLNVKVLISAFGGSTSGAGAFLADTYGAALGHGFKPDGSVLAFGRGGSIEAGFSGTSPASAGGVALLSRFPGALSTVRAYAQGGAPAPLWIAPTAVERFAMGGSPWTERIVDRPTLERSERLAGSAIVPLSGGGVATTGGERLPVERRGSQLVVVRPHERDAVAAYARGGAPWALFGEAGREGVMHMHRAEDGRPGIRAADGAVLPLTRVEGGRLGVEAFALGGMPEVADAVRSIRTMVAPYALGGSPDLERALWTAPQAFEAGGVPDLRRVLWTDTRGFTKPTPVEAFAIGGRPNRREPAAFPIGAAPASAIRASTAIQPAAVAAQPAASIERGAMAVEISPQIQLTVQALDPRTAADVILSQRKVIVQALAEELARSPAVRAAIRGDRS